VNPQQQEKMQRLNLRCIMFEQALREIAAMGPGADGDFCGLCYIPYGCKDPHGGGEEHCPAAIAYRALQASGGEGKETE